MSFRPFNQQLFQQNLLLCGLKAVIARGPGRAIFDHRAVGKSRTYSTTSSARSPIAIAKVWAKSMGADHIRSQSDLDDP